MADVAAALAALAAAIGYGSGTFGEGTFESTYGTGTFGAGPYGSVVTGS